MGTLRGFAIWVTTLLVMSAPVVGQAPADDDVMSRPSEYGIRFTPEMARGIGSQVAKMLGQRYELPEERRDEVKELIARRLMLTAHHVEGDAQPFIETMMEEISRREAEGDNSGPWTVGEPFAKGALPLMPEVRDLVGGVAKDVRPMLPLKQQFKLAGDMVLLNKGIDAFEQTLQRWSKGDIKVGEDPFRPQKQEIERDEQGRSKSLQQARDLADRLLDGRRSEWERYVKDAKAFYELDESQSASADSVLRETLDRADALNADGALQSKLHGNRVWERMMWELRVGWDHPLRGLIERQKKSLEAPLVALDGQLKDRIDQIPTEPQRQAAADRMKAALAEKGLLLDKLEQTN